MKKLEKPKYPKLDYDSCAIGSPFQFACMEVAQTLLGITKKKITEWHFRNESHLMISILPKSKVKSVDKKSIPENGKYFGFLIAPQGYIQTAWISGNGEDEQIHWSGEQYFLHHPAEIIDYIKAYAGKPFSNKRSFIGDPLKDKGAYIKHYLSGPIHELPLDPEYQKQTSTLDSLIEETYLLIDAEPYKGRMIPISSLAASECGRRIQSCLENIAGHVTPIMGQYNHAFRWLPNLYNHLELCSKEYFRELSALAQTWDRELPHVMYDDIVCSLNSDYTSIQLLSGLFDSIMMAPKFVIRPNHHKVSLPRLMDALHVSINSEHLLTEIHQWKKTIKNIKVDIERDPLDQIRASISHRTAIQEFSNMVAAKIYMPTTIIEPVTNLDFDTNNDPELLPLDAYERRVASMTRAFWKFCETDYRKILSDVDPKLPHFLEVAYQKFADSSNEKSLSANSRNLLNMLSRSLLFFMLEDVIGSGLGNDQTKAISLELAGGKPPSDGRLLDMIMALIKSVPSESHSKLVTMPLFSNLKTLLLDELHPLVTKRNRANHPPFDENTFLDDSIERFPRVISQLRELFRNIELMVPIHYKTISNDMVMHARSLTGQYFEYPEKDYWLMNDFATAGLAECNGLYLCNVFPHQAKKQKLTDRKTKVAPKTNEHEKGAKDSGKYGEVDFSPLIKHLKEFEHSVNKLTQPSVHKALRLSKYFQMKEGYKRIVMTGVFDHVSKKGPVFDYIEAD